MRPLWPTLDRKSTYPAVQFSRATSDVLLTVTNSGQAYDRVLMLTATLPNGVIVNAVPRGTNPYVLPGAQRHWAIPAKVSASSLQINITTRMGRSERTLLIGP